jgi:molybdate transport system regulatory protein
VPAVLHARFATPARCVQACGRGAGFGMTVPMTQAAPHPGSCPPTQARLRIRIVFGDDAMLGPGKADLLAAIRDTGSIAAAGRSMGMSYKRAWLLVEAMNAAFRTPLVDTARGGPKGGGAGLTQAGHDVLTHYRSLETILADAGAGRIGALQAMLADRSGGK